MLLTNIITSINIFILFSLLFFRKDNPLPNKILAFIFLIPGLYFIDNALILSGYINHFPYFFFFVQIIAILYPILVYAYVKLLVTNQTKVNRFLITGSILLLVYIIFLTIRFYLLTNQEKSDYINSLSNENYPIDMLLYTSIFYIWQMVYFSVLTYKVNRYIKTINDSLSSIDNIQITFIKRFLGLLWVLNLCLVIMYLALPMYFVDYLFLPIIVSVIYVFILYFSYHHNSIFTYASLNLLIETNNKIDENHIDNTETQKAISNGSEKHEKIFELLKKAIEVDKLYKTPELTLKILSEKLNSPPYLVSQTINLYYQKSFFDLINEFRVQEAKSRLMEFTSKDKIEGIAYEVGFNSRAAFYRAYKKYTGETPSDKISASKH